MSFTDTDHWYGIFRTDDVSDEPIALFSKRAHAEWFTGATKGLFIEGELYILETTTENRASHP